jgi:hypothetical protein
VLSIFWRPPIDYVRTEQRQLIKLLLDAERVASDDPRIESPNK